MPNLQDKDLSIQVPTIVAILMSLPGGGKTTLGGTFPGPNIMDFDGKVGALLNPYFLRTYGRRKILYEHFFEKKRNELGMPLDHNAFDDACRYFDTWMKPGKREQFQTWIVDSGTTLSEVARNKAVFVLGAANRSKTLDFSKKHGIAVMEQADWGAERSLVEQFIRMVKDSGKNVLINVHEKEIVNSNGVTLAVKPSFTGQSADLIPAMFPDVWYLRTTIRDNRRMRILFGQPTGLHTIRSELGLDEVLEPNYERIIARMQELQREALKLSQEGTIPPGAPAPAKVVPPSIGVAP